MKKNYFKSIFNFMLTILAVAFGGGSAMAVNAGDYGGDSDPNSGNALAGGVRTAPNDKGGIVQHGQDANASALQEAGLLDNKLTRKILDYHVRKYPFYTALFTKAAQMAWSGHKEAEYPEVGDIKTEARTKGANYASSSATLTSTVTFGTSQLHSNDIAIFAHVGYTIFVEGVEGYDEGVANATNGETLMLFVTEATSNSFTVKAINGPAASAGSTETKVPYIASGTLLTLGAPALAEEEVEVDPINVLPTMKTAYLQKKGYSVAITDFFNEAVKKADWEKDRIKRQALDAYKKLYTTTALFGAKRKFYKTNKNGNRICYTQEGLLNQVRMAFQLPDNKWTKESLIAIAKMLFTAYTDTDEIEVFCGSDAIEGLLNIDWGSGTKEIVYQKDKDYNVEIASFKCTFGTLHFTHEVSLTQHHLEKAALAVPMNDAMRLYRENGKTLSVDGKKGETGNVEELVKDYFIQDDCFICNAMNSMLIGPAEIFTNKYTSGVKETYKAVSEMPTTGLTDGMIVYLTAVDGDYSIGLWKYNLATTSWKEYVRDYTRA